MLLAFRSVVLCGSECTFYTRAFTQSEMTVNILCFHHGLKGTSAVQQYQSRIRVFLNLCLHQQLRFDNSLYMIHAKWFVLIIEFHVGCHLEMWPNCIAVPDPTHSLLLFLSRVETGTTTHTHRHSAIWAILGKKIENNGEINP